MEHEQNEGRSEAEVVGNGKPDGDLATLRAELDKIKKENETVLARFAETEGQNRELAKELKGFRNLQQHAKADPKKVLEHYGLDPVVVAADVFPTILEGKKEDEEPPPKWAGELQKTVQGLAEARQEDEKRNRHWARVGQIQQFLAAEGNADKYLHLSLLGQHGASAMADRMREAEEADGAPPTPMQLAEKMERELADYAQQTAKLWAGKEQTAKMMLEALKAAGYKLGSPALDMFTLKSKGTPSAEQVDTSKMKPKERIRYNLALAHKLVDDGS